MTTIGIIGGGNMGEAILQRIRKNYKVLVSEKDPARQQYLQKTYKLKPCSVKELVEQSQVVIIAVKPQDVEEALQEMFFLVDKTKLVVSIAAGITSGFLEKSLPEKTRVVRTMPNMPAMIGEGMTALAAGRFAKRGDLDAAMKIFQHVGETVVVPEDLIDAVTAVSGSGPAYVYLFMESLISGAKKLGLDENLARQLVRKTFLGGVLLLDRKKEEPGALRAKVTSKGGTTQAATDVFIKYKLDDIIAEALQAARKRAEELSKQ